MRLNSGGTGHWPVLSGYPSSVAVAQYERRTAFRALPLRRVDQPDSRARDDLTECHMVNPAFGSTEEEVLGR
jgi:hypothetical protein